MLFSAGGNAAISGWFKRCFPPPPRLTVQFQSARSSSTGGTKNATPEDCLELLTVIDYWYTAMLTSPAPFTDTGRNILARLETDDASPSPEQNSASSDGQNKKFLDALLLKFAEVET